MQHKADMGHNEVLVRGPAHDPKTNCCLGAGTFGPGRSDVQDLLICCLHAGARGLHAGAQGLHAGAQGLHAGAQG